MRVQIPQNVLARRSLRLGINRGLFTRAQSRSPCRAPRPLIPVRAMVRFHRLRLLARPLWKALHAKHLVQLQDGPFTGRCLAAVFSSKKSHLRLSNSGARKISLLKSN